MHQTLNMTARNQLLHTLITQNGGYHLAGKKAQARLLDEYCRVTGQNRKYVIRKIRSGAYAQSMRKEKGEEKRIRRSRYDGEVVFHLIKLWKIFDRPSGQRMKIQITTELTRLRRFGELRISEEMTEKLYTISSAEIDRSLAAHKEKEHHKGKYAKKIHPLLYQKIPTKIGSAQDRFHLGNIQIDLVEHCGKQAQGAYIYTLSTTDLCTSWWQGGALLTKGMREAVPMLNHLRECYPFAWQEFHTDNDSAFINGHLYRYAKREKLAFTRSRPYEKNDNFLVEQKNGRVVRRWIGYRRHDTDDELRILNEVCHLLALYQNFFQPVQKLLSKERIGSKIKRTLDVPKTPYQRVRETRSIPQEAKRQLQDLYESLNPAALKRQIDTKRDELYRAYRTKRPTSAMSEQSTKHMPVTVTFLNDLTEAISVT